MTRVYVAFPVDHEHAESFLARLDWAHNTDPDEASAIGVLGPPRIIRLRDRTVRSSRLDREALGRIVREVWIAWAREQPNPKPSWLVPWEGLTEPDREVDRRIGERLAAEGLRGRTGSSVAERLAAVESALGEPVCVGCGGTVGQHHAPDGGGCSGWFPTVREHLARIETEHRAAVYRISDLERQPVESPPATTEPTPEQIEAYLRGSERWVMSKFDADYWTHTADDGTRHHVHKSNFLDIAKLEGVTPAEMRARILGASSGAADPDRLAKVATDDDLLDLFERSEYASGDTRAARRALYDLGREHGRAERAAPARHEAEAWDALRPFNDTRDPGEIGNLVADIASLVADWQRRGEDLEAIRATRRTAAQERDDVVAMLDEQEVYARKHERASADAYLHARVRIANGEHVGAAKAAIAPTPHVPDGETRDPANKATSDMSTAEIDAEIDNLYADRAKARAASVPWDNARLRSLQEEVARRILSRNDGETRDTRPTAAEMAAELREAGWSEGSGWRSPRDTLFAWHRYTADAYAAMRAAKGAK